MQNRSIEISPLYDSKIKAASLMKQCLQSLKKKLRLENSIFRDIENDPNETGLVGVPYSLITTDEGDLDAKLTTLDPNFSAVIVDLLFTAGLEKNDTIKGVNWINAWSEYRVAKRLSSNGNSSNYYF